MKVAIDNFIQRFAQGIVAYEGEHETPALKPKILGKIFGLEITETMFSAFLVVAVLIILAVVVRVFFIPKWRKNLNKAGAFQMILEWLVGTNTQVVDELIGHHTKGRNTGFIGFWFFGVIVYIFIGTVVEVFGVRPPTTDLSFTIVLGLFTFIFIHFFGLYEGAKQKRFGKRLLHYANPITLITDSVVPISMALRLFISVFSGFMIMELLYAAFDGWLGIGVPVIGYFVFTLFHAVVQSFVFFMLSVSFISEAVE